MNSYIKNFKINLKIIKKNLIQTFSKPVKVGLLL